MRVFWPLLPKIPAARVAGVALLLWPLSGAAATAGPGAAPVPQRVVSLVPAITETLFVLGLGERVVGVSTYCDWPAAATSLPKVGTFSEPVAEAIVALRPDLVLTSPSPGNETAVRAIERTGVRVAVVQSEGGLAEARAAMLDVARAVGAAAEGERLVASIDARLDAVRAAAASLPRTPAAIVVGREPLVLAGPGSYLGELLVLAGARNIADGIGGRWPRAGLEFLVASAPEVLVDLSMSMGEVPKEEDLMRAWSTLPSVPAVAHGRVVADRASVLLRPGPRIAEAAEVLFGALHPGALPAEASAPGEPSSAGTPAGGSAGVPAKPSAPARPEADAP